MKIFLIALLLFFCHAVPAQTLKANTKDLSFMTGTWAQKHEWGDMEEFWGAPMGDCMVSTFRCVKDGKVVFYEFVVIEQTGAVPVLKLRHFNPGSIGWEDKYSPLLFPLVSLQNNKAVFETADKSLRMTYSVVPKSKMDIELEEKDKTGKLVRTDFHFIWQR
jgi:hypothetical protein